MSPLWLRALPRVGLLLLLAWFSAPAMAQTHAPSKVSLPLNETHDEPALLRSVKVILDPGEPAVQITATRPMVPSIKVFESPRRLVIDLEKSYVSESKWVRVPHSPQLSGMRVSQFHTDPPVVRIVLDLLKPSGYTWKADGNTLTVRLAPPGQTQPPPTPNPIAKAGPSVAQGVTPALIAPVPGTSGAVMEAKSPNASGSSVYAGVETAIMHLPRGGEVRVCPGTTVSVNYSQSGRDMMLGMSTGSLEVHYSLPESTTDAVVTPDFRIVLPGPGEFDYAFSADSRGNTCVRAMPGNLSPVVVAELMGDGVYDVKPSQQVTFHSGRLASIASTVPEDCGCPQPGGEVMRASGQPPAQPVPAPAATPQPAGATQIAANTPETAALPPSKPSDVQVQVEAPFVFRGDQPPPASQPAEKSEKAENIDVPIVYAQQPQPMEVMVRPPAPSQSQPAEPPRPRPQRRGFMGKLKGFFSGIFH